MSSSSNTACGVHLVGSVPLSSAEEVFTNLALALPDRLKRLPDGEPAQRLNFIVFQLDIFNAYPGVRKQYDAKYNVIPPASLPTKAELEALTHQLTNPKQPLETTYDTHALDSYRKFASLRSQSKIPPNIKFQVSLPTATNTVVAIAEGYQSTVEPFYEAALLRALANIQNTIPPSELAIQWDVAAEFAMLEGEAAWWPQFTPWFSDVKDGILKRLIRLVDSVRDNVECGLHLCYGDLGHKHFIEPRDMGLMVDVANRVMSGTRRKINWIHMPVPKERVDEAYYEPLKWLNDAEGMELYLGVVHYDDLEGTKKRLSCAARALEGKNISFGVASECGMGRTPPTHLNSILEISKAVSAPYSAGAKD